MAEPKWNENLTCRFGLLGVLVGLGFIGSQIPAMIFNNGDLDTDGRFAFPLIILGIGVMISVVSYHTLMSSRYKMSCILPPEWKNTLLNEHESVTTKMMIILYMIQWIFMIPVAIYSVTLYSIEPGMQLSFEVYLIICLYVFFLLCGYAIFTHCYEKQKILRNG